jgi:hypothetical protein
MRRERRENGLLVCGQFLNLSDFFLAENAHGLPERLVPLMVEFDVRRHLVLQVKQLIKREALSEKEFVRTKWRERRTGVKGTEREKGDQTTKICEGS